MTKTKRSEIMTSEELRALMGWGESNLKQKRYLVKRGALPENTLPPEAFRAGVSIFYDKSTVTAWRKQNGKAKRV